MKQRITVIDCGSGNLFSVRRALENCEMGDVIVTDNPDEIMLADRLVLPGVGAFADCMKGVRERGFVEPLMAYAADNRPLLGICVGMQILVSSSDEFGFHEGLGLIPGQVRAIPNKSPEGNAVKIPHIGWHKLQTISQTKWDDTILANTSSDSFVYSVHSFAVELENPENLLATYEYGGNRLTAVSRGGNIYGCQFHPEKSGPEGLEILRSFLSLEV